MLERFPFTDVSMNFTFLLFLWVVFWGRGGGWLKIKSITLREKGFSENDYKVVVTLLGSLYPQGSCIAF